MDIINGLIYYFPYYVLLVLVPAVIRSILEDALKIRYYEDSIADPFTLSVDATSLYRSIVLTGMYFPLFEEVFFRLIPFYFLGAYGLILGDLVWILMHPTWQLEKIEEDGWKKVAFFFSTTFYYALASVFYSIAWLNGDGIIAILYHMLHNTFIILASAFQESVPKITFPTILSGSGKFVKQKGSGSTAVEKPEEMEEETPETVSSGFVKLKSSIDEGYTKNKFVKKKWRS
ncbi:MAG: CPBP family glutamic-type intramembrane protease [Thermoproteota archaeon]